jgi:ATP-binding cassette subfamily C (CFTR/MRP) protein 4
MNTKVHRKDKANFISKLTLWWIVDLLWRGRLKPINQDDLDPVREEDRSEFRTELLEKTWRNEKISANQARRKPKLWKAMLKCFSWKEYGLLCLSCFSTISGNILYRYSTLKLIYSLWSITADGLQSRNQYLINIWGMIIGSILTNFGIRHFNLSTPILGIKSRAAVVGLIYKKVGIFITLCLATQQSKYILTL